MADGSLGTAGDVLQRHRERGLVVDYFCGGGGASQGLHEAGWSVTFAVNHDDDAIVMHRVNHPETIHSRDNVWSVDPHRDLPSGPIALAWFSPSCTHFSRAKGDVPLDNQTRALPWVACALAEARRPRVIMIENVPEWAKWGPLGPDNRPIRAEAGTTFRAFVAKLESRGYHVEWRVLAAHEYGAPTKRKRLFLVARRDGLPIVWPAPTHGPGLAPYRTAAECIDWTIPCPSIFGRKRPLATKTLARIAEGMRRFVLGPSPYLVGDAAATMIQTGYGERPGQRPRALDLEEPLGTVVAGGIKHAIVVAWIPKHYGGVYGHGPLVPLGTVTAVDHHALAVASTHGPHAEQVAALLGQAAPVTVTVEGRQHILADIGMRMLAPRELARAQGFPDSYILTGTKTSQIERIGNSVCPAMARALAEANLRRP